MNPLHDANNVGSIVICYGNRTISNRIDIQNHNKTGNAIRALGRMATLSASRRNSVASNAGSVLNSPRPSISGNSTFNATNMPAHMGSLHEEDDDFSIELPNTDMKRKNPKVLHKSQCSERSDSGYSECSNCSATGSVACQCATGKDSVDHIANDDLSSSVPHDLLKLKLEEIAHQADSNLEGVKLKVVVPSEKCLQLNDNQNELKTLRIAKTDERPVQIVEELDVLNKEITPSLTSPIMRSDFTNTIQMRKKSLENSLQKDKQLKPAAKCIRFEQPGKVSMLKNKFAHMQTQPQVSSSKSLAAAPFAKSKDCMDVLKFKRKLVVTEACPNQTASSPSSSSSSLHTSHSASLPNSPIPVRKTSACSTFRLSERVREVTDRLAQQHTVSTEARRTQKSPSPTRKRILAP